MTHPTNPDGEVTVTKDIRSDASNPELEEIRGALQGQFKPLFPELATQPAAVDREAQANIDVAQMIKDLSSAVETGMGVTISSEAQAIAILKLLLPLYPFGEPQPAHTTERMASKSSMRCPRGGGSCSVESCVEEDACTLNRVCAAPSVEQDERGAFEASFKPWVGQSISFDKVTDDEGDERYADEWLQGAWIGWQARAASTSANVAQGAEMVAHGWLWLAELLANDAYALSFQSIGQYRAALLKTISRASDIAQSAMDDDELAEFRQTAEDFEDNGETSTPYDVLMNWAERGFLDCTHFELTNAGKALIGKPLDVVHFATPQNLSAASAQPAHPDDLAVDQFAAAMKEKLAQARAKGRGGWELCDPTTLSNMLREHVEKGDPRDVANFCMFLWSLHQPIAAGNTNDPA